MESFAGLAAGADAAAAAAARRCWDMESERVLPWMREGREPVYALEILLGGCARVAGCNIMSNVKRSFMLRNSVFGCVRAIVCFISCLHAVACMMLVNRQAASI